MASRGKPLRDLATVVEGELEPATAASITVLDVTHDSRQVAEGWMYVAIAGSRFDGHEFVSDAAAQGAAAVCVDRASDIAIPAIRVDDARAALGLLSADVHSHPSRALSVVGVTGTNGKTTVTHYLESLAQSAGLSSGLIGTIETRVRDEVLTSTHTTPEASDIQRLLARMREAGVKLVAAEVSSHALEMGRVDATEFAVAAFTNLSQDHLDFHGTMENYEAAKRKLFEDHVVGTAVLNVDDPVGSDIAQQFVGETVSVGSRGDCRAVDVKAHAQGTTFAFTTPWGTSVVTAPVFSRFNLDNALMAGACALAAGLGFDEVSAGLHDLAAVPGRFEIVSGDDPVRVIVDYAHTPQGITEAIEAAREMGASQVIAVIGAGGDRDRDKRPLMGEAASAADVTVITSDNPRTEDPNQIIEDVSAGVSQSTSPIYEVDRRAAIGRSIDLAVDGDVVLVLGRGHEPVQDFGDFKVPFDDRAVAADSLAELRRGGRRSTQ